MSNMKLVCINKGRIKSLTGGKKYKVVKSNSGKYWLLFLLMLISIPESRWVLIKYIVFINRKIFKCLNINHIFFTLFFSIKYQILYRFVDMYKIINIVFITRMIIDI